MDCCCVSESQGRLTKITWVGPANCPPHQLVVLDGRLENGLPRRREVVHRHDEQVGHRQIGNVVFVVQTMDLRVKSVVSEPPLEAVGVVVVGNGDENVGSMVGRRERPDLHDVLHHGRWRCPTRTIPGAVAGRRGN